MPQRTNTFQQVVALIHKHLAGGAEVEESDELIDSDTGEKREVDVAIRSEIAGYPFVLSVEATARNRAADVTWVDSMLGKHWSLPTNKLILISESGFTAPAREKAEANGAVALEPEDMTGDDPVRKVVNRLGTVWSKTLGVTPEKFAVFVRTPEGETVQADVPSDDVQVVGSDGTPLSVLCDEIPRRLNEDLDGLAEQIGLREIPKTVETDFEMTIRGWEVEVNQEDGSTKTMDACLRWEGGPSGIFEYHPIDRLIVRGKVKIEVAEISLSHMKLGTAVASYGTGELEDGDALLVVTEDESGLHASLRGPDGSVLTLNPAGELLKEPGKSDV